MWPAVGQVIQSYAPFPNNAAKARLKQLLGQRLP